MKINVLALTAVSVIAFSAGAMAAAPKFGSWGYDATAMDSGVKPGDDFFDYVNGAWFKRTDIAADRTFAGIDSVLNDQIEKDVRVIVDQDLRAADKLIFHPNLNTASVTISAADFERFLATRPNTVRWLKL